MIRLRLGLDDVARATFAAPGRSCELSVSAQVIRQPASASRRLCATGLAATVDALHPGIRWRDGVVEVDGPLDAEVDVAGRGLRLMPSLWARPGVTARWARPALVYPVGGFAWAAPPAARNGRDPLASVLGATRARVLRSLADEHTTNGLARALGISPASASAHAAVLRDAGLVTSRRQGRSVRHTLTDLGTQWASDDRPHGTTVV